MTEFSYPGVYVAEIECDPKPVEGVAMSTAALIGLIDEIRRSLRPVAPGWTETNDADPGVALLELLAWLAETTRYRTDRIPDRAVPYASRLAAAALAIVADREVPEGGVLKRTNFFHGRLIDAADLGRDQEYRHDSWERLQRHNRELHGAGIVRGLRVSLEDTGCDGGGKIMVSPGYAIDAYGREIVVRTPVELRLPSAAAVAFVVAIRNPPAPAFIVRDVADEYKLRAVTTPIDDSFLLGQLARSPHGWQLSSSAS